jgi:uncharacterized repeat protein (TIGR01451 family)
MNPVLAGSPDGTEFTVTVTNPNEYALPVVVLGAAETGSILQEVTAKDDRAACTNAGTYYQCIATEKPPPPPAAPQRGESDNRPMLAAGETLTLYIKYAAEAWVPTSTLSTCVAANGTAYAPEPEKALALPCGISAPGLVEQAPDPEWIEKTAPFDVVSQADLVLTAVDAPQTAPGAQATVSFTLQDLGPSFVRSYKVTFALPEGVTLVSAGPDPWMCTQTGQQVECVWDVPLNAPQARNGSPLSPLEVTVQTPNPATKAKYEIAAAATSSASDPTPASATAVIPMVPVDLAVSKSAGSPVLVGDEATWTVTVSNVGTIDDLGKVTVTDTLPDGAVFKSATGTDWNCSASGQKVTCEHTEASFAAGASEEIVVTSRMTQRGAATNEVSVATTAYEENLSNNSASKRVVVRRAPQTAAGLPASPRRILSGKTEQGQKLTTRVRCVPVKASAAGDVSFCKITRGKGVVRVKVFGSQKMKVKVVQTAKGTKKFKPFMQRKTYLVKP